MSKKRNKGKQKSRPQPQRSGIPWIPIVVIVVFVVIFLVMNFVLLSMR